VRLLAIDAGNSRIKWGWYEEGRWTGRGVLATSQASAFAQTSAARLEADGVVVANVAGATVAEHLTAALAVHPEPRWVSACAEQCGVRSSYAEPAQLGADRWAALIGARHLHAGPCLVVNAGTTLTADALSADGIFLGGCIVAGYSLMAAALARDTAQLAVPAGRFSYFPDNTPDAIASGALNALAGAIERMARYMEEAGEATPHVMLSGGDAALLRERLCGTVLLIENLVLEGLAVIGLSDPAAG
jgi:type III pantothenate kinase